MQNRLFTTYRKLAAQENSGFLTGQGRQTNNAYGSEKKGPLEWNGIFDWT